MFRQDPLAQNTMIDKMRVMLSQAHIAAKRTHQGMQPKVNFWSNKMKVVAKKNERDLTIAAGLEAWQIVTKD